MPDITTLQGITGDANRRTTPDGTGLGVRLSRLGAMSAAFSQASYQAAVERGNVFGVCNQSGITTQAGLSATTPALTLYNPAGSGKIGVLWYAGATFTVAFTAAAVIWVAANTNVAAAAVTGTLTTAHRNLKLGATNNPGLIPLLAATLPAAPVAIATLGAGLTGVITTVPQVAPLGRLFDGGIELLPGTAISIQTSTASGASGTFCDYIWEEMDS